MTPTTFNVALLVGWLLISAGAMISDVARGIMVSGGTLVMLTLVSAWMFGVGPTQER